MAVLKSGSRPPWVGLGAAVWVQIAAGNAYTFPLYSSSLKSVLGFNQQQLTILGVANDIGENVGILPGIACNKLPPSSVLLVGVCASFFGYGILWLAVSQTILPLPYWVLWIALCIATNSSAWLGTAVLVTNMRNFPLSRGTIAGILKGYVGLSAAVFTEIYSMVLNGSASSHLLLLTLGIPTIGLLMMYFIRPCTPASRENSSEQGHFLLIQSASLALAVYLLTTTVLKDLLSLNNTFSYIFIAIMVVLLMAPLAIPLKMTLFPANNRTGAFMMGPGVTVLNNLAQIGVSLGVDDATILLSLFSFFNFLGRLGAGAVSEHLVRSKTIPRTFWMAVTQSIMILTFLLYASSLKGTLQAATALLGICYGVQCGIMIPTASELFGLKHFGIIFNFMQLGNPVGALLFSGLLAGQVYDLEAAKQSGSSCLGPSCYRLTFLVLAGVCGLGTILSIILTVRIRPVYQMLYGGGSFRIPQSGVGGGH
ncbi:hypothetical protein OROHE_022161 [Orobanche hederae]